MKNSKFLFLVFLLTFGMLLSACSGQEGGSENTSGTSSEGKITIDVWTFWGSETRRPVIEKMLKDFNESQDKYVAKHTYLPWGDIWTKNLASIAAGNPADVIVNDINTVAFRAKKNQATNLAKYLKKDPKVKERFFPELWKAVEYNGDPYALPFNTDTRFLYYNKKHFEEVGLDPEDPPQTWAELEEYAKKLDKKENGRYTRVGFYPLWGNWGYDQWLLNADKGRNFVTPSGEVLTNTPRKVKALEWINKWTERIGREQVNEYKAQFGSKQANPFLAGKVSMFMEMGGFYTQIRDYAPEGFEFGVAKVPEFKKGSGHWSWGGGFVLEMPKGAKHPKGAWELMKFLTAKKAQKYWAVKNFDNVANIEAAKEAAKSDKLSAEGRKIYKFAVDNMKWTKLTPVPIYAPEYWNYKNPEIDKAILGEKSPKEALDSAQKAIEELIQEQKRKE